MTFLHNISVRFFLFALILLIPAVTHGVQVTVDCALDDNDAGSPVPRLLETVPPPGGGRYRW